MPNLGKTKFRKNKIFSPDIDDFEDYNEKCNKLITEFIFYKLYQRIRLIYYSFFSERNAQRLIKNSLPVTLEQ